MAVDPDSPGVRFPPPLVYLGALLLGLCHRQPRKKGNYSL